VFTAPSPSRSSLRRQPSRPVPVAPPTAVEPTESSLQSCPEIRLTVPLRGSASAPLPDLLACHAEVSASALEHWTAQAVHKAAEACVTAAQARLAAAEACVVAAQARAAAAEARIATAEWRKCTAWTQYATLVGVVVSESLPPSGSDAPVRSQSRDGGKGKARALTPSSDGEEEVDELLEPGDDDNLLMQTCWTLLGSE
jgi:hypothetical protein